MNKDQICGYEDPFSGPCVLPIKDHPFNSRTKRFIHSEGRVCPLCKEYITDEDDVTHSYIMDDTVHRDCLIDSDEVGGLYFAPKNLGS